MTVLATPCWFIRLSSISAVASSAGGVFVSFAHGKRGSSFQTCTWGSMMRYDDAPRTERAPTAPTKALEIRVLRVKRFMNLSSRISVGVSIHQTRVWHCFFTPNDLPGSADVPSAIVAADRVDAR